MCCVRFYRNLSKLVNIIWTVCFYASSRGCKYRTVLQTIQQQRSTRCLICQSGTVSLGGQWQHKSTDFVRLLKYSLPSRWAEAKRHRLCFTFPNLGLRTRNWQRSKLFSIVDNSRHHLMQTPCLYSHIVRISSSEGYVNTASAQQPAGITRSGASSLKLQFQQ